MRDVQNSSDARGIPIQKVGVKDVHLPFLIKTKAGGFQSVLARIQLTAGLPQEFKGTHMSRFIEVLSDWRQKPVSHREMESILKDINERLGAKHSQIEIGFKYFIDKKAPVSGLTSPMDYDCVFAGSLAQEGHLEFTLGLSVPYTSLCPCSKEISAYGAHNQRGMMNVNIRYRPGRFIWIEDLAALLEKQASSPVYPLLKREDEKYVTECAYDNPKFVEDVLRDLVIALRAQGGVEWFAAECESFESIHNHSAYAAHVESL